MTTGGRRPIIEIRGLTKRFGPRVVAVDDVSCDIFEGEFFALLGPSGCGKTTLLRMLAGLEAPDRGTVLIDGRDMGGVAPNRRPVNMVFQSYAVFPHMSVADNVGYGLKVTGTPRAEIGPRVEAVLDLVRLGGLGARLPDQLSGGQLQRVALARALIKRPKVLLLDEPLSALDAKLREAMRLELVRLQHSVGITFVIVTHDQEEALAMADRIAVMDAGKVRQVAPPAELYQHPNSRFVAGFIGRMNLFEGTVAGIDDGGLVIEVSGLGRIRISLGGATRGEVGVAVRPGKVRLAAEPPPAGAFAVAATVSEVAYHGSESHVFLTTDAGTEIAATVQNESGRGIADATVGARLWVSWAPEDTLVLEA